MFEKDLNVKHFESLAALHATREMEKSLQWCERNRNETLRLNLGHSVMMTGRGFFLHFLRSVDRRTWTGYHAGTGTMHSNIKTLSDAKRRMSQDGF